MTPMSVKNWPLMMGFKGVAPEDDGVRRLVEYLEEGFLAGVIFFSHNLVSPAQVKELTDVFRSVKTDFPPLLAIDQEGGRVQRLCEKNGFRSFTSARDIAESCSPEGAADFYDEMARQTDAAGFNYVFGPVVDLHSNSCPVIGGLNRAYGVLPSTVVAYAKAFVEAHRKRGIITCLKHFPGHGFAVGDTHEGWVDVTSTYQAQEQEPFKSLIESGYADSIMTAHIFHREWDARYPVSLSDHIIPDQLRCNLAYQGLVVTDDLHMGAIGKHFDLDTILYQAIKAQNDLLIFSGNPLAAGNDAHFDSREKLPEYLPCYVEKLLCRGKLLPEDLLTAHKRLKAVFRGLANMDN
tara:strand:- start:106 stop:1155 length:1050 start_codon:yes stop_codon:yes gene_type:complete